MIAGANGTAYEIAIQSNNQELIDAFAGDFIFFQIAIKIQNLIFIF